MGRYILFIFGVIIFLSSCGRQKTVVNKYYVIDIPEIAASSVPEGETYDDSYCKVNETVIYPAYSTRQIANRRRSHELVYFENHTWAVRPQEVFTRVTIDFLQKQKLFKNVSSRFWNVVPEYYLETTIYNLEVSEIDKDFSAHLQLEFRLIHADSNDTFLVHHADRSAPLEKRDLDLMASEISRMYHEELKNLAEKIKVILEEVKSKKNMQP
jgi:ABC-type uncharacterized transport system auxiliary subunit